MKYNAVTVTQLNKYLKDRFDEDENLNAILVKFLTLRTITQAIYILH